jgi:iron complex transport system permease protein
VSPPPTASAPRSPLTVLLPLAALLLLAMALRLWIGSSSVGWPTGDLWRDLLGFRAHRLAIGLTVGAALAVGGVALQALLRNPLAEPFILGLSTGAGAGVMAQAWLLYSLGVVVGPGYLGAAVGAAASMLIVYAASRRHGVIDPLGLLLTGVVLGTINGALIMLFNYAAGPGGLRDDVARWMMGYVNEAVGAQTLYAVAAATIVGGGVLFAHARAMDVVTLSEAEAVSLGVNLPRMRTVLFIVASALAAGAVVLTGPVAFVGLVSPHLARLLLGPRHAALLPAAAMLGATLVLAADTASSLIALTFGVGLIPLGVFTAMIGGPAFLWMLRPRLGRSIE